MRNIYIITGVSKGLGYALANQILNKSSQDIVVGLSRSKPDLKKAFPQKFEWIQADFNEVQTIEPLLENTLSKYSFSKICFISNAGDINPIVGIGMHSYDVLHKSLAVNIFSPAIIINYLIKKYSNSYYLVLVNISSGAANKAIKGWSLYSSAKAYMKMYFDALALELSNDSFSNIFIFQIDPGAMDTEMQNAVRNADVSSDQVEKLRKMYESGSLSSPEVAAEQIIQKVSALLL